ncbi:hypothetical protein HG535_0G05250 [Zygotorulaspora mrakii]|uniref:Uncharacterized protein n=1 Tax=Zygotorulaspora mrakii TaxID=42260 RepID=A0A7H9BA95_ZYGMR|nr:uncharacterized protein HG535_0G05250 [Zygotorulaspora mrakii]QLG74642.1 hypothetical protein HG535_0G05250 [Zygotorulaspora mrakii]
MSTKNYHIFQPFEKDGKKYAAIPKKVMKSEKVPSINDLTVIDKNDMNSITKKLESYGICIVKKYLNAAQCGKIKTELQPHYYRKSEWNGSPFPKETTVVTRAVLKSPTCLEKIACDDMFYKVSHHFLSESNIFWIGDGNLRSSSSDVQLYSGIIYRVGPGAHEQMYHREDMSLHNVHPSRKEYHYGDDTQLGLAIALTPMNKNNGATRAIIGSHLWGPLDGPGQYDKNMEIYLELDEGDAAFMLGTTYHAASANESDADRIGAFFFMNKSYQKQEENYHVDTPTSFFENLSFQALKVLGLHTSLPFCGHIDYTSPAFKLNPKLKEASTLSKGNYTEIIYPSFE